MNIILCPECHSDNIRFFESRNRYICIRCGCSFSDQDQEVKKLRIFLSYGHDANEELVLLIKTDLEKRGHDVWFDKNEIKFGDEWRRSITDGILRSNRVLSFLSKHSTRDPGVCRDEIAIAIGVKGGNIQTILVESEQEVQPPVNIGHIQWLDMHDWHEKRVANGAAWDQWYKAKLAEIVRVVESDESRRFSGEIEKLNEYLKPIKSDARISGLLSKGFYGRKWMFEAVENWRQDKTHDSRLFWIMGDPGVGKSAFAAQLTHKRGDTIIAAQFCEWDKPDHRDARRVVCSIAFQLATRLPDYRKLLLTLPEISELDRKEASELFDYLLSNPLKSVISGGRERYLIVIDALDEAGESGRNPLVEMLARNAHHLPAWLGIIVTSRPEFDVKTPFQALIPFPLDTRSEFNRIDIRDYLLSKLASQLQNRQNSEKLIEQILEKSEGVFLYVERFCDDIQQGHFSLNNPDQFPQGLGGIFAQYFHRQFPDLEKFRKEIRPALRAILAAREPLPIEILLKLFNWQDEELRDFIHTLGSLFPVTKTTDSETIKPYHKSLADWMGDDTKVGSYFVSEMEGHRMLADLGWIEYEKGKLYGYLLSNFVIHLHQIKQFNRVYLVLCDIQYISSLGVTRYRRLPPAVRLWVPDELKVNLDDEHGNPGDWRIIQYDGYRPPDSIWQTCTRCGCSPYYYGNSDRTNCPKCGWAGSEEEVAVLISIKEQENQLNESKGDLQKRKPVFLSYSFADAVIAERISNFLNNAGYIVWVDAQVEVGFESSDQEIKTIAKKFRLASNLSTSQKPTWIESGAFRLAISDCIRSGIVLVLLSKARIKSQDFGRLLSGRFQVDIKNEISLHSECENIVLLLADQFDQDTIPTELQKMYCFDLTKDSFDQRMEELITFLKKQEIK